VVKPPEEDCINIYFYKLHGSSAEDEREKWSDSFGGERMVRKRENGRILRFYSLHSTL